MDAHEGADKAHSVAILEEGTDFKATSVAPGDGQMIEAAQEGVNVVARIMNLPPHRIGGTSDSLTYSNETNERLAFYTNSIRPHLTEWEQEINLKLLGRGFDAQFDMSEALRADTKTRFDSYAVAISAGWMTKNEARRAEGLNEVDGLDDEPDPIVVSDDQGVDLDDSEDRTADVLVPILTAAVDRILTRQRKALDGMDEGRAPLFFERQPHAWARGLGTILSSMEAVGMAVPAADAIGARFSQLPAAAFAQGPADLALCWNADDITAEILTGAES